MVTFTGGWLLLHTSGAVNQDLVLLIKWVDNAKINTYNDKLLLMAHQPT